MSIWESKPSPFLQEALAMTSKHFRLLLPLLLALATAALASTTWYVNGVTGSDTNNCLSITTACMTIGHALSLASSGDKVRVAAATYNENLSIGISLNVIGAGAGKTIIDGGGVNRVVTVSSAAANVTLSGLRIQNGNGTSLPGVGGVSNVGTLTLKSCEVANNVGGGISNSGTMVVSHCSVVSSLGLGIENSGALTLNNSVIARNPYGISNSGTMTITNSTITKNTSTAGYGIVNYATGTLILNGTTVSQNTTFVICRTTVCPISVAGIWNGGSAIVNNSTISGNHGATACKVPPPEHCTVRAVGGGIANSGTLEVSNSTISANGISGVGNSGTAILQNSILSNKYVHNCNGPVTSNGYNLSSDATCAFSGQGDMNSTDPMLGPLQNNGGPTQTMALPSGSPAIDAGNPAGCTDGMGNLLKTDQRGMPRPDAEDVGGCDIGAYESQSD
jgi:hypothetical protein